MSAYVRLLAQRAPWALAGLCLAVLACGCRSTRIPESNRAAAVVITNREPEQIEEATREVFANHGYAPWRSHGEELVFQKPGTFWNAFFYGDWFFGPVWRRVRIYTRDLDANRTLLDCDLFMVQEAEDPLFQRERKLRGSDSKSQRLLDEISSRLNAQPGPAARLDL